MSLFLSQLLKIQEYSSIKGDPDVKIVNNEKPGAWLNLPLHQLLLEVEKNYNLDLASTLIK